MKLDPRLKQYPLKEISELYDESLPYHNFAHALAVAQRGLLLADRCKKYKINVRESVVLWSSLFHDAGYHINPKSRGCMSREDYSATIAKLFLRSKKIPQRIIDEVVACIISTHRDAPFSFVEQKIVRVADLWGLTQSYKEFKKNTLKLKREYELLNKKEISMHEWVLQTKKILAFYLLEHIILTPEYADKRGNSIFHTAVRKNLNRLLKEYAKS